MPCASKVVDAGVGLATLRLFHGNDNARRLGGLTDLHRHPGEGEIGLAAFAEANGAGFHLPETRAEEIGPMVAALLDERARLLIRANCARLAQENGAGAAAAAITRLVTGHGMRLSA